MDAAYINPSTVKRSRCAVTPVSPCEATTSYACRYEMIAATPATATTASAVGREPDESIGHRNFLLVTSANFSWSAEYGNLELGVLIDSRNLAEAVEHEMREVEEYVFEHVRISF